MEALRERLYRRGSDSPEKIEQRLRNAGSEMQQIRQLTYYHCIVNRELEQTKTELI